MRKMLWFFSFFAYFFGLEVRAGKDFLSKMGSDILGPRIGSSWRDGIKEILHFSQTDIKELDFWKYSGFPHKFTQPVNRSSWVTNNDFLNWSRRSISCSSGLLERALGDCLDIQSDNCQSLNRKVWTLYIIQPTLNIVNFESIFCINNLLHFYQ